MEIKMSVIPGKKPGVVAKINVKLNDEVKVDDVLANVETGKGNRQIKASINGIVKEILVQEGSEVSSNEVLFILDEVVSKEIEIHEIKMPAIPGKPGVVAKINVKENDIVKVDDILANVETGKGNRIIKASKAGIIHKILVNEGQEIKSNELMFEISCEVKKEETKIIEKDNESVESDLVIIGAGPGGYVAAIYAAKNNLKVTLVEKNKLGGTCLNVGCIPTKSLVKSSEVFHETNNLEVFGLKLDGHATYDMKDLIKRKDKVVSTLVGGIDSLMKANNINVIYGEASFVTDKEILVKGDKDYNLKYKDVIIASGSKVAMPRFEGTNLSCVFDSTKALANEENLETITIVGGGVIGMEFACLYNNLGIKVNVVEYLDRVLPMIDKEVSSEFLSLVKDKGLNVYTSAAVTKINETIDGKAIVTFKQNDKEYNLVSDKVIIATGRTPELEALNLDVLNIEMNINKPGIKVDEHMRTSKDHIYAIGDVTNVIQLAHVASHQALVAVDNIIGKEHKMDYKAVPNVIFSSPEIASVGLNEDECKEKGINYKVSRFDYSGNGKALTMNATEGFVKLIKDAQSNVLIGATIMGADASTLISAITLAIQNGMSDENIRSTIFAHPTTSEVIHEAAMGLGVGYLHQ